MPASAVKIIEGPVVVALAIAKARYGNRLSSARDAENASQFMNDHVIGLEAIADEYGVACEWRTNARAVGVEQALHQGSGMLRNAVHFVVPQRQA